MVTETVLSDTIQVVTFSITEKSTKKGNYAVPIDQVKEIRTVDAITKIPKSKSYVKGIMNLRGKIIPIVDVNGKIGVLTSGNADSSKQRILVADVNDTLTGLLVDEVNEVMRLSTKEIEPAPPGTFEANTYIKGIANVKDKLIVLLDVSKFLLASNDVIQEAMTSTPDSAPDSVESASTKDDEGVLPEIEAIIQASQH